MDPATGFARVVPDTTRLLKLAGVRYRFVRYYTRNSRQLARLFHHRR